MKGLVGVAALLFTALRWSGVAVSADSDCGTLFRDADKGASRLSF